MHRLVGKRFRSLCRTFHFVLLSFGETISEEEIRLGNMVLHSSATAEYTLNLTTEFHIRHKDKILLGYGDLQIPYCNEMYDKDWDWIPTDRPDEESSVFDVLSRKIAGDLEGHQITRVEQAPWGDIVLFFSNGYVLETFVAVSRNQELWTLTDNKTGEATVFSCPDPA